MDDERGAAAQPSSRTGVTAVSSGPARGRGPVWLIVSGVVAVIAANVVALTVRAGAWTDACDAPDAVEDCTASVSGLASMAILLLATAIVLLSCAGYRYSRRGKGMVLLGLWALAQVCVVSVLAVDA
ncbi:hypothetical protein B4N89_35810 [Embleya scabrispora]|uniref:Uncharacterized protein n=1 Tax=Embleya scabrispora TaxID=159449 RepID=A0A1T3NLG1_9ACTN|nr:hypothetical protein [Embleya scabrispora]OPC77676.1 hypothetical protein B4N89_35810 [Embleya scabrispora]